MDEKQKKEKENSHRHPIFPELSGPKLLERIPEYPAIRIDLKTVREELGQEEVYGHC